MILVSMMGMDFNFHNWQCPPQGEGPNDVDTLTALNRTTAV